MADTSFLCVCVAAVLRSMNNNTLTFEVVDIHTGVHGLRGSQASKADCRMPPSARELHRPQVSRAVRQNATGLLISLFSCAARRERGAAAPWRFECNRILIAQILRQELLIHTNGCVAMSFPDMSGTKAFIVDDTIWADPFRVWRDRRDNANRSSKQMVYSTQ